MSGFNRWEGLVRVGADPELRFTTAGRPVLGLRVACTVKFKSAGGEQKEKTIWLNANVWGPRAEALAKINITKGTLLFIDGELTIEEYEKDGVKRTKVGVDVDKLELLAGKRPEGAGDGHGAPAQAPRQGGGGYGGGGYSGGASRAPAAAAAAPSAGGDYGGGAGDYGGAGGADELPF